MYLLAMVCYIPFFQFSFDFNGDSRLCLRAAELCLNGALLAAGQIRRIFFQAFYVNGNIIMLVMLSLKNKLIESITIGDTSCYYIP